LLVFIGSVIAVIIIPPDNIYRQLAAVPALGSLFGAILQVFRDQSAFERQLILNHQQQAFNLGVASHMANRAFDKHVEFCEEYMVEVDRIVSTLWREGPTPKATEHSKNLLELKNKYSTWITRDIINGLEPFEQIIREIGSLSGLTKDLSGTGDPTRPEAVKQLFKKFKEVLSIDTGQDEIKEKKKRAIKDVEDYLRSILGIEQLTTIRQRLIQQALDSVPGGNS